MLPIIDQQVRCQRPANLPLFDAALNGNDDQAIEAAKAVCNGCPIRVSCYQHGVDTKSVGVFGGVFLAPKFYRPKGVCARNHDITGLNGRPHNGRVTCRICETDARLRRRAK